MNQDPPEKQTPHHYVFAHVALRQIARSDPYAFFGVMASPQRQEFLDDLWGQICQNCDKDGPAFFGPNDIAIRLTRIGEFPTILVVMPTAHFTAEAHMVCIVLKVSIDHLEQRSDKPEVGYFTLEQGMNLEAGTDRTVLCAWSGDSHINYGDGPEPTPTAFLEKVKAMVQEQSTGR